MAQLNIKWNESDKDIVAHLGKQTNTSDYIRELIRRDIKGETIEKVIVSSAPRDSRLDSILANIDEVYKVVKRIERSIPG